MKIQTHIVRLNFGTLKQYTRLCDIHYSIARRHNCKRDDIVLSKTHTNIKTKFLVARHPPLAQVVEGRTNSKDLPDRGPGPSDPPAVGLGDSRQWFGSPEAASHLAGCRAGWRRGADLRDTWLRFEKYWQCVFLWSFCIGTWAASLEKNENWSVSLIFEATSHIVLLTMVYLRKEVTTRKWHQNDGHTHKKPRYFWGLPHKKKASGAANWLAWNAAGILSEPNWG